VTNGTTISGSADSENVMASAASPTMPSAPAVGRCIIVSDYGDGATNNVTVTRGGSDLFYGAQGSGTTTVVITTNNTSICFRYLGGNAWRYS
jgi:hypothetical protein